MGGQLRGRVGRPRNQHGAGSLGEGSRKDRTARTRCRTNRHGQTGGLDGRGGGMADGRDHHLWPDQLRQIEAGALYHPQGAGRGEG